MRTDNVDTGALLILRNVKPWLTKQQYKTLQRILMRGIEARCPSRLHTQQASGMA